MLLNALAALKLLRKEKGIFRNTPLSARFFADASPDSARKALLHTANIWHRWSNLTGSVLAGTPAPDRRWGMDKHLYRCHGPQCPEKILRWW